MVYSIPLLIVQAVFGILVGASDTIDNLSDHHVEVVKNYEDHILVRSRRNAETGQVHF